ncbi:MULTISPECIES: DNA alkylation repair protein [unclassified Oceanobacter]|uniref:DNA alkylation repair protein n=1 Tax=unclassified Oceanobacter TaxID=2620260 RepID=UPI0027348BD9|nr:MULTISPECIES: DNA alkylation repair protein [unclassified Oceanobacter]MDP2549415.1 DNA alkylation repair protein [Oceanobacter sp. 4_MG-2023]MDP2610150.1 DNA alkylation repair protein [Oceanobacter sp. 1_MG-2023]MDP2613441.1 DNA alkylation repair protein [Oceanobacter sp. 2_MG-2023]
MAEPLKNRYGLEVADVLAQQIDSVWPDFDTTAFMKQVSEGYDALELMARGQHIADVLQQHLPAEYDVALDILMRSVGAPLADDRSFSIAAFYYLPHTCFVASYGLQQLDISMAALYQLTQRFTAEFSIRAFIQQWPVETMAYLQRWCNDPNHHVRRLVSEGTRPRLPWAGRLPAFQRDPAPVLALLEQLKDDPELYVRRSVANNLNDIGKDHPELLVDVCRRWMQGASGERRWIVRHALRSAVKRCDADALAVLGFDTEQHVQVTQGGIQPAAVTIGEAVELHATLLLPSSAGKPLSVMVDFRVHYVKASGRTSAKVFKLKQLTLMPGQAITLGKSLSLAERSTRRHYPGSHHIELLVNGTAFPLGVFELCGADHVAAEP